MEKELEQRPRNLLRVVLYGPESTGKTTLAKALAEHFDTEWVPEFSRDYLQAKWDREGAVCGREDMLPIARGQMALENELAEKANKVLFCDTNLLESVVYSRAYFNGYCDERLLKPALKNHYDLYFLTYIDLPWVKDDLRDRPDQRDVMFNLFRETLEQNNKPYKIIRGDYQQRFDSAVETIDKLLRSNASRFQR